MREPNCNSSTKCDKVVYINGKTKKKILLLIFCRFFVFLLSVAIIVLPLGIPTIIAYYFADRVIGVMERINKKVAEKMVKSVNIAVLIMILVKLFALLVELKGF